jgi:hypothetical protein
VRRNFRTGSIHGRRSASLTASRRFLCWRRRALTPPLLRRSSAGIQTSRTSRSSSCSLIRPLASWKTLCPVLDRALVTHRSTGLVRALAEFAFGGHTAASLTLARAWLRERRHWFGADLFDILFTASPPLRNSRPSCNATPKPNPLSRASIPFAGPILEGQQRVDLMRSPSPRRMAAICAKRPRADWVSTLGL